MSVGAIKKVRDSNIELLRIVAIAFVVLSHVSLLAPSYDAMLSNGGWSGFELLFLRLGKIGVHVFFLITGYFTIKASFRLKGIGRVWGVTLFYSLLFLVIGFIVKPSAITPEATVSAIFPVIFNQYWFVTTFILVSLMSPALNYIAQKLTQQQYKYGLISVVSIFYLVSFIIAYTHWAGGFDFAYPLITYALTYLIGGYFALYPPKLRTPLLLAGLAGSLLVAAIWSALTLKHIVSYDHFPLFIADNGIVSLIGGISLFLLFKKLSFSNKYVNWIAGSMFAVYLISTNKTFINEIYHFFNLHTVYGSWFFYIAPFVYTAAIVIICVAIDKLRIFAFEAIRNYYQKQRSAS